MSERKPHPRWTDPVPPKVVSTPDTYSAKAQGPVRRVELHATDGQILGHVWTDGKKAAGFLDDEAAGPDGVRAANAVWAILRDAYEDDVPASGVLDPKLYAPTYKLSPAKGDNPADLSKQADTAIRSAAGRKQPPR